MVEIIPAACLAIATIMGEAGNETFEGKLAVASVIRNRMEKKYTSDGTVAGTVLYPKQFSMWNTTDKARLWACSFPADHPKAQECARAWEQSAIARPVGDSVLYHADYIAAPPWALSPLTEFVKQIGRHRFFRVKA